MIFKLEAYPNQTAFMQSK